MSVADYKERFPRQLLKIVTAEQKRKYSESKKKWWEGGNWTEEMSKRRSAIATRVNTGRKVTEETKRKLSLSVSGFHHTEEAKNRIAAAGRSKTKEKNSNWKGGVSPYFSGWQELSTLIKKRDDFKCQSLKCKGKSKILQVHHINGDKKDARPENLITLCKSCHAKLHPKGFLLR